MAIQTPVPDFQARSFTRQPIAPPAHQVTPYWEPQSGRYLLLPSTPGAALDPRWDEIRARRLALLTAAPAVVAPPPVRNIDEKHRLRRKARRLWAVMFGLRS